MILGFLSEWCLGCHFHPRYFPEKLHQFYNVYGGRAVHLDGVLVWGRNMRIGLVTLIGFRKNQNLQRTCY